MSLGSTRRDVMDATFSTLVRERACWKCEACGKYFPVGERHHLHASHFVGRKNRRVRWDPENCAAHCDSCHAIFTDNPLELTEWVRQHLGEDKYIALRKRALVPLHLDKALKAHIKRKLKAALEETNHLRELGVEGRISFASPYEGEVQPLARKPKGKPRKKSGKRIQSKPLTDPTYKRTLRRGTVKRAA